MGCPAPKIAMNGGGASLMKNPLLAGEIIKAVSKAVDIPVTVKIRKGWDDENITAVELAKIAEKNGAAAITVHGRTRMQMYSGKVDYNIIAKVKKAVDIPVIANGDIVDVQSAAIMFVKTKRTSKRLLGGLLQSCIRPQNATFPLKFSILATGSCA